jgi:DNA-binding response OmpR family regulator
MTNPPTVPHDPTADAAPPAVAGLPTVRRALLVSEAEVTKDLEDRLVAAGLAVSRAGAREAPRAVKEMGPSVVLLAFGAREGESALVTLARRLRSDFSTLAVPVVFLFREDGRTLRSAAQHFGADDYFAQDAPAEEIRARLASLFWRAGAARRAAPALAEQRDEIDNFIFLLDAVAADLTEELTGTVALVEATGSGETGRMLREAHAFLKLNLRRADAVAGST